MRPVTAGFLRTLRGGHVIAARVRVVAPGQTGVEPVGTEIKIMSGDVRMDANAAVRASLDLTTDGTQRWPHKATDLLAPYGNELFVERGVKYGNGVTEYVSQGYFRIDKLEQDGVDRPIRITAPDRMAGIVEARLLAPRQYAAGTALGAVVEDLVLDVYPSAVIEWDDSTDTEVLIRSLVAEEERHPFLLDLVQSYGKTMYWDYRGVLVIRDVPDPTDPVFEVNHGRGGVLVSMGRELTREGVYNAVVATGEAPDTQAPARAVAIDDNPVSPTYWFGSFGKVPRFYSSPFITTEAQALSAASSLLRQKLGLPYSVDFSAVPNPALEPLDAVTVTYPLRARSTGGRSETHVIDTLTIPLTEDAAMTAATREQTLVAVSQL